VVKTNGQYLQIRNKKNMRTLKLIMAVFFIGTAVTVGYSQKHHGKAKKEDRINKMDEVVKFTGDQRTQVQALFDDMAKKKRDAFCANEMGSDGMKKAMKDIRKDKIDGLKKILNKDQQKLWKDHMKSHKGDKNGKHDKKGKTAGDRIDGQLNKMNEVVVFTGTQKEDLKKLYTDLAKRSKDAMCNNEPGSDALKSAMKTIHEDRKEGTRKILTEDQMKLWKDHKKSKRDHSKDDKKEGQLDRKENTIDK